MAHGIGPTHLARMRELTTRHRALVVVAPPGAGKTTRVPPALAEDGPVIVLQPRRIAARSLARRIAFERRWTLGEEVGWHVRFDRKFGKNTRVLVATEGILTARMQSDPLLSEFATVIIDEFHERSLHADLALALARQAMLARDDLRLVVMSATLDPGPVQAFLGDAPLVEVEGRLHPIDVRYAPHETLRAAVSKAWSEGSGHVLVFLPGAPEIRKAEEEVRGIGPIVPLHGSLSPDEQDAAIDPTGPRRIILATNVAETSLTIEGVTDVIDSGLHKVVRYDAAVGIDRLETERISRDSADQRAGRAGRTQPGRAVRLWDERMQLDARREPEIRRVDLAGPLLDLVGWGADPRTFDWFERPPDEALERDLALLEELGALDGGRLTEEGKAMRRLPIHPRHARVMLSAGGGKDAAAACAILSEGLRWAESREEIDLLDLVARVGAAPYAVKKSADEILRLAGGIPAAEQGEESLRRALYRGYADRLAKRREKDSTSFVLASGFGAALSRDGHFPREAEYLVALDLVASTWKGTSEGVIRLASVVDPEWVRPTSRERREAFDPASRKVRAWEVEKAHAIVLRERPVGPDAEGAARAIAAVVAEAVRLAADDLPLPSSLAGVFDARELEGAARWLRRARAAGVELDLGAISMAMSEGRRTLPPLHLTDWIPWEERRTIERLAPDAIAIPSGRHARVEYRADGSAVLSAKLQELFGLAESPRVGMKQLPVTIELLSPAGRPVQTTSDLRSFWNGAYQEVRKELRGRYPKHPWPEDPWTAPATARAKRRT